MDLNFLEHSIMRIRFTILLCLRPVQTTVYRLSLLPVIFPKNNQ